uniref:Carboxyl-terminal protease n=1 Tax=uncultured Acidobacteriota bacterium TaxID=171953 RepID=H5SH86_9BACT|nr:carboxyl-terminal protease [uncultured Acidobacteriota bacterium]
MGVVRMAMKFKVSVLIVSVVVALYVVIGGLLPRSGVIASYNDPYSQLTIFQEVLTRIINDYVDEPDLEKVRVGALRGLAEGLDPYSAYLTPEQVRRLNGGASGGEAESGLVLSKVAGYAYVVSVLKGSPAEIAGLRPGDIIEYIGTRATRDMSLYEARELLVGPRGTEVEVRVFREGRAETFKFQLDRFPRPKPEAKVLERGLGYLKLATLDEGESARIRAELESLIGQGVNRLILDLRGVATGSLAEAVTVANYFIGSGTLAKTIGREGRVLQTFAADPQRQLYRGDLVALIDRSTAGAAEIIAAAILENKRGELVGERTFGAGGEQKLFPLRDGGGLYITVVKYATPSGKPIMGSTSATSGIVPTVEVPRPDRGMIPEELEEREELPPEEPVAHPPAQPPVEDLPLKRAIEILRKK